MSAIPLFAALVSLTNAFGTVSIDTLGARALSYVPQGGAEVFARLNDGTGGMPLCWPWFGGEGPAGARRHGLARYREFAVIGRRESPKRSELVLRLESDAETRKAFPHDFRLTVSFVLADSLTVTMRGENAGTSPFDVTAAFHPYFRVTSATNCVVGGSGIGNYGVTGGARDFEWTEGASHAYCLEGPGIPRPIEFASSGDRTVRVWNPGPKGHLSKTVSSRLLPDEWRGFVCVENGCFRRADGFRLPPGGSRELVLTVHPLIGGIERGKEVW